MSNTGEKKKENKGIAKRIFIGVVIALVLLFIVFMFITTNFLGNSMIVTEMAYHSKAYDVVKTNALVVRDEEYLKAPADGILVYQASDGDKIIANGTVATVYNSESDVANMQRISELEDKIAYLEGLNSVAHSGSIGLDTVNSQLNEKLVDFLRRVNSRSFEYISDAEDALMTSVFRRQIITGEHGSFDEKIAELNSELTSLRASTGSPAGTVTTASSGYFVSKVDGYEDCFSVDKLDSIYYSDIKKAEADPNVDPDVYVGKIIKGVNWYLACPVTADEAVNISHNSSGVSVRIPYALSEDIPARVMYVNDLSGEEKAVVVLRCNFMSDAISRLRNENVEIVVNSYEGLKISKSAIHDAELTRTVEDENGSEKKESKVVQGVYVEYGNEIRFRQIVIVYSGEDYVICSENPDRSLLFTGSTVSLYDKVVIEGGDLYDGKLIK